MIKKQLHPIPLDTFKIGDHFWKGYQELVRKEVIPYQWEALNDRVKDAEPSHCIHNMSVAAGKIEGEFEGCVFQDSDFYKWIEAASWSLLWHPDAELEKTLDDVIALMGEAQLEDGYLDTYYILKEPEKRFTNLMCNHELYCMGHMVEAAVAHFKATGKRTLLQIAMRYADCIAAHIGPGKDQLPGYPGHEIAEMALVALYEVTDEKKYLDLAKYFIDRRGQSPLFFEEEYTRNGNDFRWADSYMKLQYYQAGKPVREQEQAQGHAVRAVYLYSGMAEVAGATDDESLFHACSALWDNITGKQMYITGSIGSTSYGEAFNFDYDLPNDTVYGETCAAIGLVFFARRMFELTRDSRYIDVMERALYNGVISGMSLDGKHFFYVNPLEVNPEACEKDHIKEHVKPQRQKWFACACCPPNLARLLSSIGGYAYESSSNALYMNLFIGGDLKAELGGVENSFHIETEYPWKGNVCIRTENAKDADFRLAVRVPGWCRSFTVSVNGKKAEFPVENGYVVFDRTWKNGDEILLSMEMPVEVIEANPRVRADAGRAAVMRGPVVYCLEEADNGSQLQEIRLGESPVFTEQYEPDFLSGVVTLESDAKRISEEGWDGVLYRPRTKCNVSAQRLKWIPYYAWANRSLGEMAVWIHQ